MRSIALSLTRRTLLLAALACCLSFVGAARVGPPPADPFADPKNDQYNPLRYIASNTLTSIGLALFLVVDVALYFNTWKWGAKYMLSIPIGATTYCIGLACRYGLHVKPESSGIYIAEYLFVVLSPCAFIAGVYVLLGRLVRFLRTDKYLLVSPLKVTKIFITSDVCTFLIQAAGGGTSTSHDLNARNAGQKIFLVGLALQLVSFFFFTTLMLTWAWKVRKFEQEIWRKDADRHWFKDWRMLLVAMIISCIGILIRSFYRVIEISEGYSGHLATTEYFFYILDALPCLIAIVVYVPVWPARYIRGSSTPNETTEEEQKESHEMDSASATPDVAGTLRLKTESA